MLTTRKKRGGAEKRWKVPLNSELLKVLTELKRDSTSEYLFPNEEGNHQGQYLRYLAGLCKKAGVKPFYLPLHTPLCGNDRGQQERSHNSHTGHAGP